MAATTVDNGPNLLVRGVAFLIVVAAVAGVVAVARAVRARRHR